MEGKWRSSHIFWKKPFLFMANFLGEEKSFQELMRKVKKKNYGILKSVDEVKTNMRLQNYSQRRRRKRYLYICVHMYWLPYYLRYSLFFHIFLYYMKQNSLSCSLNSIILIFVMKNQKYQKIQEYHFPLLFKLDIHSLLTCSICCNVIFVYFYFI